MIKATLLAWCVFWPLSGRAELMIAIDCPKTLGQKTIVRLEIKNTLSQKVRGAKGTMFLIDEKGKVAGQATRWFIGGTKGRSALAVDGQTNYYFIVPADKPFNKVQLMINRVVLEGGKVGDPIKDVVVKEKDKR